MNSGYVTVKCPRCNSTSEISERGIRTASFLCPVCLEGEINDKVRMVPDTELGEQLFNYFTPDVIKLRAN